MISMYAGTMKSLVYAISCAMLAGLTAAHAADATFPLGLEKLHWDMARAEVSGLFPLHEDTFRSPTSPPLPGETLFKSEAYNWQTCHFEGVWRFFKTGLHAMTLADAQGSRACAEAILGALRVRYGEARVTTVRGFDNYEWKTATTNVKFMPSVGFGSYVWFSKPSDEALYAKP
jgi:hypothetical protein